MKRLLFLVLLLVTVLVFAAPGAIGLLAERGHERALTHLVRVGHPLSGSFTRGWFESRTQHLYRVEDPRLRQVAGAITGASPHDTLLIVDSRVHHGPLPLATLHPAWTEVRSTLALRDAAGTDAELPGRLTSRLQPDGQSHFHYRAEPGERTLDPNLTARWQDIDVELRLNRSADRFTVDGAAKGLELSDGQSRLSIADLTVDGIQRRAGPGLWAGTTAWHVGSLSAPATQAGDIDLTTEVSSTDGQPVYRITGTVGSLQSDVISGQDLRIDVELRNVDGASAAEVLALVAEGRASEIFSPTRRALLRRVLAGGPQLTLHDLRVPSGDADLEGTASVNVAAGADPAAAGGLANAIDAQTDLAVPRSLVEAFAAAGTEQTRTAIELMIRLRILKPEGSRYRVTARYVNGRLSVNGFPVPLPQF